MLKMIYLLVILCCCCVLPASSNRNTGNRLTCPYQEKLQQAAGAVTAEEPDFLPMHAMMGHI